MVGDVADSRHTGRPAAGTPGKRYRRSLLFVCVRLGISGHHPTRLDDDSTIEDLSISKSSNPSVDQNAATRLHKAAIDAAAALAREGVVSGSYE